MEIKQKGKRSHQRGDNWTQDEKDIFLEIMKESSSIIENKMTDTNSNKKKSLEWVKVQKKLKELSGKDRDVIQLKGFWRRIKISAKKNVAQHKRALNMTGGGQQPPSLSEDDMKILELCPTDFIVEQMEFDSDGIFQSDQTNDEQQNIKIMEEPKDTTIYDMDINENFVDEAEFSFIQETVTVADVHDNEVHIEPTKTNPEKEKKDIPIKDKKKEKAQKVVSTNKATILKSNEDLKKRTAELLEEEYKLKFKYHKQELCHQQLRHKLEIDILLLEKEKKELEIKKLRKSLEK